MTVLAIVQTWNRNDPIRGFIVPWMEALAARVDRLLILTLEQSELPRQGNISVSSLGKERGANRLGYLAAWHRAWLDILREQPPDIVFTHMSPIFTVLSAPYARRRRIPIVTWFAHRQVSAALKLAHRLSARVLTINRESYRYRPDDALIVGHGIDCDLFKPDGRTPDLSLLLSVGRISPIKDVETFLRMVARLRTTGHPLNARWIGEPPDRDRAYGSSIDKLKKDLRLEEVVAFGGTVPNSDLSAWYCRCLAHVNLCPTGALDKAALRIDGLWNADVRGQRRLSPASWPLVGSPSVPARGFSPPGGSCSPSALARRRRPTAHERRTSAGGRRAAWPRSAVGPARGRLPVGDQSRPSCLDKSSRVVDTTWPVD